MADPEQTRSRFLLRNLLKGVLWVIVIIAIFILAEDYIQANFEGHIQAVRREPVALFSIFFTSEVFFGLVPPEIFMLVWILDRVPLHQYVINLSILTVISYLSGLIGYFIGTNFSRLPFLRGIYERYLLNYGNQFKLYSGFLVFVAAVTPVPFSATCMLAGYVKYSFRWFLVITIFRIIRFALYGWMVWSFPSLFAH